MTAIMYFTPTKCQALYRHSTSQKFPEKCLSAQSEQGNPAGCKNLALGQLEQVQKFIEVSCFIF